MSDENPELLPAAEPVPFEHPSDRRWDHDFYAVPEHWLRQAMAPLKGNQ
jgi:hypothetical protein